jgi:hypothetical protein
MDQYDTIEIPFILILNTAAPNIRTITEIECTSISDAKAKLAKYLGQGKCAIIKNKTIPYHDYIPF